MEKLLTVTVWTLIKRSSKIVNKKMQARRMFSDAGFTIEDAALLEAVFDQTTPPGKESENEKWQRAEFLAELFVKGTKDRETLIAIYIESSC